jgi:hypothetical protein
MTKPDALMLANQLQQQAVWEGHYGSSVLRDLLPVAAAELRRLHAENEALRKDAELWRMYVKQAPRFYGDTDEQVDRRTALSVLAFDAAMKEANRE